MDIRHQPLEETNLLRNIIRDYLYQPQPLEGHFSFSPTLEGGKEAAAARKKHPVDRDTLVEVLQEQYAGLELSEDHPVWQNIQALKKENAFTVATGHQLQIFTGYLFFIYKLVSAINYAKKLKEQQPENDFVPAYWMASEDHDFEEISKFNLFGREWKWETEAGGKVGAMKPQSLKPLIDELGEAFPDKPTAEELLGIFRQAYLEHKTLADATRYLVHRMLGHHGLVIIDADDARLKEALKPVMRQDILKQAYAPLVEQAQQELSEYKLPVNPREINFFWLGDGFRERVVQENDEWRVLNNDLRFSQEEMERIIEEEPQRLSPNVIMRPLYQELILPNIAYIGGTNELAYWFELKGIFDQANVFFPQLLLRDSVLWVGGGLRKKMRKLDVEPEQLFLSRDELVNWFLKQQEETDPLEELLQEARAKLDELRDRSQEYPPQLRSMLVKQATQHIKDLEKLEKSLNRELKQMHEKNLERLGKLYDMVYSDGVFQERYDNFIMYYLLNGQEFFKVLTDNLDPLRKAVTVVVEE